MSFPELKTAAELSAAVKCCERSISVQHDLDDADQLRADLGGLFGGFGCRLFYRVHGREVWMNH